MTTQSTGGQFRPRLKGITVVLLLLVGVIIGNWNIRQSRLDNQLAELRSNGLPTTASEVNDYYEVPIGEPDTTELWLAATQAADDAAMEESAKSLPFVGNGKIPVPLCDNNWDQLESSRQFLNRHSDALNAIHEAAASGGAARFPVDFSAGINTNLPHTHQLRQVSRLLQLDAYVNLHDGNADGALKAAVAMYRTGDAIHAEPILISQLIHMAVFAIASDTTVRLLPECDWSDEQLQRLQQAASKANFLASTHRAMCGERAITLTTIRGTGIPLMGQANVQEALRLFFPITEDLEDSFPAAIESTHELQKQIKKLSSGMISRLTMMPLLLVMPALEQGVIAGARAEARQHCTIIAIAAWRHRQNTGQYPESLDSIVAKMPDHMPRDVRTDPFTGQPLHYVANDNELLIYSVGQDLMDDGGDVSIDDGNPLDVGIRLLQPDTAATED